MAKPIREKKSYVKKAHTHGIQDSPSAAAPPAKNIALNQSQTRRQW